MIGDTTNFAEYAGNASTSTPYVIPFRFDAADWVKVTVTTAAGVVTEMEQTTHYTLGGTGSTADGTFTTVVAVPSTSTLRVYREAPGIQSIDLETNTPLPAESLEAQLDRLAMAAADGVPRRFLEKRIREIELTPGPPGPPGPIGLTGATGGTGATGPIGPSGATETTASIIQKLGGAEADPERIGTEYLPERIEGIFELADATGTVIADRQIAGVNGLPAVGDGATLEGKLLGQRITRTSGSKTAVQLQSVVFDKLLSIPVSAESLTNQRSLYFDIAAILEFSADSYPTPPLIYVALTDYTGFVAFTTHTEINNLGCRIGFGTFPVADTVFQVVGPMGCNIAKVVAAPPFLTTDKYRIRQNTNSYEGATLTKLAAGASQVTRLTNHGLSSPVTASKAPSTPEDCMLSFYLYIPASAAETRTLKYNLTVKSEF